MPLTPATNQNINENSSSESTLNSSSNSKFENISGKSSMASTAEEELPTDSYKQIKQKSSKSFKTIGGNLKEIQQNYDLAVNPETGKIEPNDHFENEALVKIQQIHKNEKTIKLQFNRLITNEFRNFQKKLLSFSKFINLNFGIIDVSNDATTNNHTKTNKINKKIDDIQIFAETIDRKIRMLEQTKKVIENNKTLA